MTFDPIRVVPYITKNQKQQKARSQTNKTTTKEQLPHLRGYKQIRGHNFLKHTMSQPKRSILFPNGAPGEIETLEEKVNPL